MHLLGPVPSRSPADPESSAREVEEERLAAMRHLSRRIAHEVNNFLTPVLGYGELLQVQFANDPKAQAWLDEICKAARRAHGFARQLQAFSGRQDLRLQAIDPGDLVRGTLPRMRERAGTDAEVTYELDEPLPRIQGDPVQLAQVLVVLAEDVGLHGAVHVGARFDTGSGQVAIAVFDPRVASCLEGPQGMYFEPYALPKGHGPRSGMGMAAAAGIVQQHGGSLRVDAAPRGGRRLTAWLPAV